MKKLPAVIKSELDSLNAEIDKARQAQSSAFYHATNVSVESDSELDSAYSQAIQHTRDKIDARDQYLANHAPLKRTPKYSNRLFILVWNGKEGS